MGIHRLVADEDRYEFYDPTLQKYWNATVKAFPGARVSLMSMAENHKKFVVMVDSPTEAPAVSLVDIDRGSADWLGQTYDVPSADLAPTSAIAFKAADGLTLTGYLTLPKGREDRALPLVVLAHGGPAARDEPGFDWWTQAIASRGYAVLRVNFRGSGGFGWNFIAAGFGQWGRKMRTDLSDGVRYLAARGTIDPKRVAIVGASYGGYAALAGPTLEPGVYRCAVSVAGISDLKRFASWSREDADASSQRYWLRFIGVQKIGDPRLSEISPIDHVDALTAPILLIHGQDDTVVPYQQSQEMFDALRRAGKAVDLVRLAHEDHHLLMGATRLKMLRATIDFLLKNNPP
ncbi:MAG: prolyl oligopeptidase family serine peptidase [Caulobacteraceae bacterium]